MSSCKMPWESNDSDDKALLLLVLHNHFRILTYYNIWFGKKKKIVHGLGYNVKVPMAQN